MFLKFWFLDKKNNSFESDSTWQKEQLDSTITKQENTIFTIAIKLRTKKSVRPQ